MTDDELIQRLRAISTYMNADEDYLADATSDWWPFSSRIGVAAEDLPAVAVAPESILELRDIVILAAEAKREIVLRGGGTNQVGAIEPRPGAILLDLRGLNVIEPVNPIDLTVRVDAGVHGGELLERLQEQGYTLTHDPRSLNLSTVGGWIAMGSAGYGATRYGGIADHLHSIDVMLADASLQTISMGSVSAPGPSLGSLFVGSEGAFGIITAATLRVRPLPDERRLHLFSLPSFASGLELLRGLVQRGVKPAIAVMHDTDASLSLARELELPAVDSLLMLGFEGPAVMVQAEEALVLSALNAIGAHDRGVRAAEGWYERRHRFDWIVDGNEPEGWIADEIDVVAPWSRLPAVIEVGRIAISAFADQVECNSTAVYEQGAIVSFRFFIRKDQDEKALVAYQNVWRRGLDAVIAAGAEIAHHNGIGQVRAPWLSEEGLAPHVMWGLKQTLDPDRRFNQGRLGV